MKRGRQNTKAGVLGALVALGCSIVTGCGDDASSSGDALDAGDAGRLDASDVSRGADADNTQTSSTTSAADASDPRTSNDASVTDEDAGADGGVDAATTGAPEAGVTDGPTTAQDGGGSEASDGSGDAAPGPDSSSSSSNSTVSSSSSVSTNGTTSSTTMDTSTIIVDPDASVPDADVTTDTTEPGSTGDADADVTGPDGGTEDAGTNSEEPDAGPGEEGPVWTQARFEGVILSTGPQVLEETGGTYCVAGDAAETVSLKYNVNQPESGDPLGSYTPLDQSDFLDLGIAGLNYTLRLITDNGEYCSVLLYQPDSLEFNFFYECGQPANEDYHYHLFPIRSIVIEAESEGAYEFCVSELDAEFAEDAGL